MQIQVRYWHVTLADGSCVADGPNVSGLALPITDLRRTQHYSDVSECGFSCYI
jgi:hypothetical protein